MRRAFGAFGALAVVVWFSVWGWSRLPGFTPLSDGERADVMRVLRAALDGQPLPAVTLARAIDGPLIVNLYDRGAPVERIEARAKDLGAALADAARTLSSSTVAADVRAGGRLKVDLVMARAPILTAIPLVFQISLVPGLDGLGLDFDGREQLLLPDDLMRADVLAAHAPVPAMEFTIGLDSGAVVRKMASLSGAGPREWAQKPKRWFRFRAESFVEPPPARRGAPPLPVVRGNVPGPEVTRDNLRAAAVAGGQYLLRHLGTDGRFDYEYFPGRDQTIGGDDYSLPRHAGAIYYLAQLYGATRDPALLDGVHRALGYLSSSQRPDGCDLPERACVGASGDREVDLGSSALTLAALSEYERATGDHAQSSWARRLAAFVVSMQRPNGDFRHLYDPHTGKPNEQSKQLYYSGEAAFALAKRLQLPGLDAAESATLAQTLDRGLDYLTGENYGHLAGQYFFLEDHWTCLAAEAGWDHLPTARRERYADFCDQFAAFLRRTQFVEGESVVSAQPDVLGAYGFSPLMPPHATPVGSRSETTISTYQMGQRRGRSAASLEDTRRQILRGMRFLLAHQIDDDGAYLMAAPEAARGGLLMSDVARHVRIDFVQHACSAMLRAIDLL
jgi:hypothetical protein